MQTPHIYSMKEFNYHTLPKFPPLSDLTTNRDSYLAFGQVQWLIL